MFDLIKICLGCSCMLSQHSLNFYRDWRENYQWPPDQSPRTSEEKIAELLEESRASLCNLTVLGKPLLQKIHHWKTQNRARTTEKYAEILRGNEEIIPSLQKLLPVSSSLSPDFVKKLIDALRIGYANLPVCSAQASFLCNRALPILDRYVAQFFSHTVSPAILSFDKCNMSAVLRDISTLGFVIEDDGTHKCIPRLAVYQPENYARNRDVFACELLPELNRIADELNDSNVTYQDIYGKPKGFSSVDVEMAVFAFGTQNRRYFECWYREQPTSLGLQQ